MQLTFAQSEDPIQPIPVSITRMAVTTEAEAEKQHGDNRTMGDKHIVPYALYRTHGFVSAHLAGRTGFSGADLDLLCEALVNMFDHDRSAARGEMAARRLILFRHAGALGNAPAHKHFELVTCQRSGGGAESERPPRSFEDYRISFDPAAVPDGVTAEILV